MDQAELPRRAEWDDVGGYFRSLGSPLRVGIIVLLQERQRSVNDLVQQLGVSQPLVSQHLRVLRTAGLVRAERHGREMIYSVSDPGVSAMLASARRCLRTDAPRRRVRVAS